VLTAMRAQPVSFVRSGASMCGRSGSRPSRGARGTSLSALPHSSHRPLAPVAAPGRDYLEGHTMMYTKGALAAAALALGLLSGTASAQDAVQVTAGTEV